MTPAAPRLALIYSSVGHFFFHYLAAMYFTIVVSLAEAWQQPFHELIRLWTPAFVLIGLAALPAGRLADRWSAAGMLVVMFLGMGGFTIACGLVEGPGILPWLLAGIGLFAAIYHPVGIAWLVRHAGGGAGRRLAVNEERHEAANAIIAPGQMIPTVPREGLVQDDLLIAIVDLDVHAGLAIAVDPQDEAVFLTFLHDRCKIPWVGSDDEPA